MDRLAALAISLAAVLGATQAQIQRVDDYVEAEMRLNGIPGVSIAIAEEGRVSHLRAFGMRSVETGQPMSVDTPVELASVSKSLTALAVLELERAGALGRDSVATSFLPELDGGTWRGVTVRDLLRHRSGLRRKHDFLVPCCGHPGHLNLDIAPARLAEADLVGEPGDHFSYANSNYVLLAAIVERASGVRFPDYMRDGVFRPLGLQRTTLDPGQARRWDRAERHEWQWGRVRPSPSRALGWYGSSLTKSTARDMGAYMAALLAPELVRDDFPTLSSEWWVSLEPHYDQGWTVHAQADWLGGDLVLEHTGDIWGSNTAVVLAPRRRTGVAVLANLDAGRAGPLARSILIAVNGSPLPQPQKASVADRPDAWAVAFLAAAAAAFLALGWHGSRVVREVRRGHRAWDPRGMWIARSAVLVALGAWLIYRFFGNPGTPHAALPTTVGQALPALVAGATGLLLLGAVSGLAPKRRA